MWAAGEREDSGADMIRWLILIATFAVWALCMFAVWAHCKPPDVREATAGLEAGLDALFDDANEPQRAWRIFLDLSSAKQANPREAVAPWDGVDEKRLLDVGWLETTLKKNKRDESRVEQVTEAVLAVPPEARLPILEMMGTLHYHSRADISMDQGLEVFDATFTLGLGIKAQSHGVREGGELKVTQQITQQGNKLLDERTSIPLGERGTPLLDLMPFQQNRQINAGVSWNIAMLDTNVTDLQNSAQPKIVGLKVTCTGRQEIVHEGHKTMAFTVVSSDGKARAWYSPDGMVLKQAYNILNALDLMVVRADLKTFKRRPVARR